MLRLRLLLFGWLTVFSALRLEAANPPLQCVNGKFRIAQFTDMHFGEGNEADDSKTVQALRQLLVWEKPDFVALTGDIVTGNELDPKDVNAWPRNFQRAIDPIIASKTKWAYTLGNHDDLGVWGRDQIIDFVMNQSLSYTHKHKDQGGGVSNYVLTVWNNGNPSWNIWFLDSMDDHCYGRFDGWGCVHASAVRWYVQKSRELEETYGLKVPGVMYVHIPVPETVELWNNEYTVGKLEDMVVYCSAMNTGLFAALVTRGDVQMLWHGHCHSMDYYGQLQGITVGYGRKTGYGGYGPWNIQSGARILELDCKRKTWNAYVRQDNSSIIDIHNDQHNAPAAWNHYMQCRH